MSLSASRLFAMPLVRRFRVARMARVIPTTIHQRRSLFISPWNKKKVPDIDDQTRECMATLRQSPYWRKIVRFPDAIKAVEEVVHTLIENGIDLSETPKQPSFRDVVRLMTNTDFRDSLERMKNELRKAGVDLDSEDYMKLVMRAKPAQERIPLPWEKEEKS